MACWGPSSATRSSRDAGGLVDSAGKAFQHLRLTCLGVDRVGPAFRIHPLSQGGCAPTYILDIGYRGGHGPLNPLATVLRLA